MEVINEACDWICPDCGATNKENDVQCHDCKLSKEDIEAAEEFFK